MKNKKKWIISEIQALYNQPLMKLLSQAHEIHCAHHSVTSVQACQIISFKTGGCSEDCKYCAQSSHFKTQVKAQPMLSVEKVVEIARKAAEEGATRVCLGAAWRQLRDGKSFDKILNMIEAIAASGVEVCCTLGFLKPHQARKLKEAGLYAYNHNLDTSRRFYSHIITTHTYDQRLETLRYARDAGISLCCGGILGMGETLQDRLKLLLELCNMTPPPESVPINILYAIPGTPLERSERFSFWDHLRLIALARILMPETMVRLSAGRQEMTLEQHALCFFAGANSIHCGDKLLTANNRGKEADEEMFQLLGLQKKPAYETKRTA